MLADLVVRKPRIIASVAARGWGNVSWGIVKSQSSMARRVRVDECQKRVRIGLLAVPFSDTYWDNSRPRGNWDPWRVKTPMNCSRAWEDPT
jgi:hypothetical protein